MVHVRIPRGYTSRSRHTVICAWQASEQEEDTEEGHQRSRPDAGGRATVAGRGTHQPWWPTSLAWPRPASCRGQRAAPATPFPSHRDSGPHGLRVDTCWAPAPPPTPGVKRRGQQPRHSDPDEGIEALRARSLHAVHLVHLSPLPFGMPSTAAMGTCTRLVQAGGVHPSPASRVAPAS